MWIRDGQGFNVKAKFEVRVRVATKEKCLTLSSAAISVMDWVVGVAIFGVAMFGEEEGAGVLATPAGTATLTDTTVTATLYEAV